MSRGSQLREQLSEQSLLSLQVGGRLVAEPFDVAALLAVIAARSGKLRLAVPLQGSRAGQESSSFSRVSNRADLNPFCFGL